MNDIVDANDDDGSITSVIYGDLYYFDEETLSMLRRNDPDVVFLDIKFNGDANPDFGFDPLSINWHMEGSAISKNTQLKVLDIEDLNQSNREAVKNARDQRMLERNAKSFFRAVAANRSIESFHLKGNILEGMDVGETFAILTGFFENNHNLCSLNVSDIALDSRTAQILVSALSRCSAALGQIGLIGCDGLDGDVLAKIVDIVACRPNLQCLNLDENDISDEAATVLGKALSSKSLKEFSLQRDCERQRGSITPKGVEILSKSLKNSSLDELTLRSNYIGLEGGICLIEALHDNSSLKVLDLYRAVWPSYDYGESFVTSTLTCWDTFFCSLKNCGLRSLNLGGNNIGDGDLVSMVGALNTMKSLTELKLRELRVTASGWNTFFVLLQRPGSVLESLTHLEIYNCYQIDHDINDEGMISFAKALVSNTTLQRMNCTFSDVREKGGWAALSDTICDTSDLESIFNSNHTFYDLSRPRDVDPDTASLLKLNMEEKKSEVARKKIIKYHFSDGDNTHNLHDLMSMKTEVLPWAIAWIGRDTAGLRLLHRLIWRMPSLFDFRQQQLDNHQQDQQKQQQQLETTVGGKRKRGRWSSLR